MQSEEDKLINKFIADSLIPLDHVIEQSERTDT